MPRARFDDVPLHAADLRLRPVTEDDIDPIFRACQDAETLRWLPLPQPYTEQVAATFVREIAPAQQEAGTGLLRVIDHGGFAGLVDLKATNWRSQVSEIGYWVAPWARGRGLAGRSAALLADWGLRTQDLQRVEIRAATGNLASQKAAVAAGFTREGVARSAGIVHGGRVDLVIFGRIRADLT
ncbi:GNAT family N-acetyltransferase [Calidifontibacter sp. DB0510]|uniref:GNAT family N-acetyltransferase n=1 Tax=Metallococcus carri TaxID=1656884 RepID=A0A967EHV6_9MICO|nr:GNAT family protein [Metallococcus carri]NHN57198.1 GNAT family N-acetyltransferase [Metallococcus carri]NOP37999.1 GNAT family N-acetyltransferase [Calidifontibacter sp. DB2511S]